MLNYPHNPSGQVATRDWLRQLCEVCSARNIRLFNDAAYYVLSYGPESATLSDIAPDYPDLSWAEASRLPNSLATAPVGISVPWWVRLTLSATSKW